jgi:hypothetical protein
VRNVIALGALLTLALGASYWSWTHPPDKTIAADKVAMYRAAKGDVTSIAWKTEDLDLVVEKRHDDHGDYAWVTSTERKKKDAPPADTDAPAAPPPEVETTVTQFKGSDAADKLWDAFSPIQALRELDATASPDKTVFGLDAPKGTIEVVRSGETLTMPVGGETWGAKDRYVGLGDKVFLVDDADLRPLQYGKTRLIERNVQPLAADDIDSVSLTRNGQTVTWIHKNREDKAASYWARDNTPDQKDEVAGTWLKTKLLTIRLQTYQDTPVPDATPAFSFSVTGKGQTWTVDVTTDAAGEYYAQSTFDRALVKLTKSVANEAAQDVDTVLAGTAPAPAPAPEAPSAPPGLVPRPPSSPPPQ